mmetsp:Transcript_19575/g.44537  ORF Transcript_19575/g.44537 Transcript_19575/m.44537 type:complete len:214 (+) Transcript_19575:52-693(+)
MPEPARRDPLSDIPDLLPFFPPLGHVALRHPSRHSPPVSAVEILIQPPNKFPQLSQILVHLGGSLGDVVVPPVRHPPGFPTAVLFDGVVEGDPVVHVHLFVQHAVDDEDGAVHFFYAGDVGENVQAAEDSAGSEHSHSGHEGAVQYESPHRLLGGEVAAGSAAHALAVEQYVVRMRLHGFGHVLVDHLDVGVGVVFQGRAAKKRTTYSTTVRG